MTIAVNRSSPPEQRMRDGRPVDLDLRDACPDALLEAGYGNTTYRTAVEWKRLYRAIVGAYLEKTCLSMSIPSRLVTSSGQVTGVSAFQSAEAPVAGNIHSMPIYIPSYGVTQRL